MTILDRIKGLPEQKAVDLLKSENYVYRIRVRDGKAFLGTADVVLRRVNLFINDGTITSATFG